MLQELREQRAGAGAEGEGDDASQQHGDMVRIGWRGRPPPPPCVC
eukprot:COSAG01_NODE_14882_length_1399_cov_1.725385_2_plen_44_part_01